MERHDLKCVEQKLWQTQVQVNSEEIADALAMTYRAVRHSEQSRVAYIDVTEVTLAADILRFSKA